jgi:DNA/RNA endonuclease YhcR with UshA esterase domain
VNEDVGVRALAFVGVVLIGALVVAAFSGTTFPVTINGQVGEVAVVDGIVNEVHVAARSGVTFIDMGGRYPDNTFAAVIWPDDAGKFPNIGALYGQRVRITGPLHLYQGKREIILRDAGQLKAE